jgi:hypothetical protein
MMSIIFEENNLTIQKTLKKLAKRYITLIEDLDLLKKVINLFHTNNQYTNGDLGIFEISGYPSKNFKIYKVRKFACRSLPNTGCMSGLRLIYAFNIQTKLIIFIEIYYKGDQKNEDKDKIKEFLTI